MTKHIGKALPAGMDAMIEKFIETHDLCGWDVEDGRTRFGYLTHDMRKITKIVNALKKLTFVHSTVEINIRQNNVIYRDDEILADNGHDIEVVILLDWEWGRFDTP